MKLVIRTLLPALLIFAASRPAAAEPVSFSKEVAPILIKNCQACHGPREPKGGYQLFTFELLQKPGESDDPAVTPGMPEKSALFNLIAESDKDIRMPKDGDPLPAEQVALVKRWIAEGAKYDAPDPKATLASIVPKLPQPDPPAAYRRPVPVTAVAFSPDGKELAVSGYHEVTIWDPADGKLLRRIKNVAERVYGLAYNADGSLLAVSGGTPGTLGEVKLFKPADGTLVKELGTMSDVAFRGVFSPDGKKLVACAADRTIRFYDVESGKEERVIEDHADWVMAVAWNSDGTRIVSGSRDKTAKVFDTKTGESVATYPGHNEQVYGVAFTADGKQALSCGADRKVHAWGPGDGKKAVDAPGGGEVYSITVVGDKIFISSSDKSIQELKVDKLCAVRKYGGLTDNAFAVSYHEGTKRAAGGSFAGEVRVWNTEDGKDVTNFLAAPGYTPPAPPATAAK